MIQQEYTILREALLVTVMSYKMPATFALSPMARLYSKHGRVIIIWVDCWRQTVVQMFPMLLLL